MLIATRKLTTALLIAASVASTAGVASAAPVNGLAIKNATTSNVETVQFRRWGWGVAGGLVAGAIIGGIIADQHYGPYYPYGPYGPYPYYGPPPGPYYPPPYVGPVYAPGPAYRSAAAYCASRFRSYNPRTGMYRGHDGVLRRCP